MAGIFISYRRCDQASLAQLLHERLAPRFGVQEVFWDEKSIPITEPWPAVLEERVALADVLLVLIGQHWLREPPPDDGTDWVVREVETALDYEVPVLPVLVDGALVAADSWLPERVRTALQVQGMEIRQGCAFIGDAQMLVHKLEEHLGGVPAGSCSEQMLGPGRLPYHHVPLQGREEEVAAIRKHLVAQGGVLTLCGAGGMGKTRVACAVAERLVEEGWDCRYVDLSAVEDEAAIATAVANALHHILSGNRPATEVVAGALVHCGRLVLVLDNFEQVVRHAKATVGLWQKIAPAVRLLVTSRIRLKVDEEVLFQLGPLDVPVTAVRLFAEHASRASRGLFSLDEANTADVLSICTLLEGQPLPIVLAAGKVHDATPHEILAELRCDLLMGEDKLEAVICWTWRHLDPLHQEVFAQICIFSGSFDLAAARAVLRPHEGRLRTPLPALQRLCGLNLLYAVQGDGPTRYCLFKTIQDYGRRLWPDETPPEGLVIRWAEHYLTVAECAAAQLYSPSHREALDALLVDADDVLSAHRRLLDLGACERAARLLLAFAPALAIRGPWEVRRDRLQETVDRCGEQVGPTLRAHLLRELSDALWAMGDVRAALREAERAVTAGAQTGDAWVRGWALYQLARVLSRKEDARDSYEESLDLMRQAGCARGEATVLFAFGGVVDQAGDYDRALELIERSVAAFQAAGDPVGLQRALNRKGLALWHRGDAAAGEACFVEAHAIARSLGDGLWEGGHLTNRGLALTDLGRLDEAFACFERAGALHERHHNREFAAVNQGGRGRAHLARGDFAEAESVLRRAKAEARAVQFQDDVAVDAAMLARCLLRLGRLDEARTEIEEALQIQRTTGMVNRRFCRNLIVLAAIEDRAGYRAKAREALVEARPLIERFKLASTDASLLVRDDLKLYEELASLLR